ATHLYTLSLRDALPISPRRGRRRGRRPDLRRGRRDRAGSRPHGRERGLHAVTLARALVLVLLLVAPAAPWARAAEPTREEALQRSEEHTSELQSPDHLV